MERSRDSERSKYSGRRSKESVNSKQEINNNRQGRVEKPSICKNLFTLISFEGNHKFSSKVFQIIR